MRFHRTQPLIAAAALALCSGAAQAQEKITLRLADSLPSGHVIHELVGKPFSELVTKATNGQVVFQHFPAEQLGKAKDMAQLTVAGVADIAYVVPSYSSEKYPLTAVAELPGIFDTQCQGSLAFYKVSHNGGLLEQKEFAPNQLRPLLTIALPAYQIQLANGRVVKSAKDLEGLKIRTTGGAMDLISGRTELIIVMEHCDSKGRPKLKKKCAYPLTGQGCVSYVVTDLALLKWEQDHFTLLEVAPGFTAQEVIALTDMQVVPSPDLKFMA